nr:MAG: hypothetical protein [Microviridae sp.]
MAIKFYSNVNRPKCTQERHTLESMTERAGYMPVARQVKSLFDAGQQLVDYRKLVYDDEFGPDADPDPVLGRKPGSLDPAVATQIQRRVTARLKAAADKVNADAKAVAADVKVATDVKPAA